MYKGIKKEQFTAREVAAAISALGYYLDGVTFITEYEIRQFLHAFLSATISARKTCRARNRRLDSTRAEAETFLVSDDLERRGREVEVDEKERGDAIAAVDAGVDDFPYFEPYREDEDEE